VINYDNPFIRSFRRCDETLAKIAIIRNNLTLYKTWIDFNVKEVKDHGAIWKEINKKIEESRM
jgi:hypothetical protein